MATGKVDLEFAPRGMGFGVAPGEEGLVSVSLKEGFDVAPNGEDFCSASAGEGCGNASEGEDFAVAAAREELRLSSGKV